ncbi:family 8 putative carbohydrate esterase [Triangularia setosa]|uniref:pectinesterase n=1 Tax=Triangularia setosa TaxID=2587417 RepID=A0AAN6WE08_9PEZI|nr:family 8 putative carbohydrate esterase [Podospora setosa]
MHLLLPLLGLITPALAQSRTSPPSSSCIRVSKTPSSHSAQFSTLSSAISSLSTSSTSPVCIFLYPGTYNEQVLVPASLRAPISIYGSTTNAATYKSNTVTIVQGKSQANTGASNDETGTLRVKANGVKIYNLNIVNSYGKGSQAVALSAYADSGYYGCSFQGYQDTVLANRGKQYYSGCEIVGVTDFIFGQESPAWFEKCDIRVLASSVGYITASGRSTSTSPNYYVFNNCNIAAKSGQNVANGAYYLGRPWREYARVVFQSTAMSSVVNAAGWRIWNTGDERTSNVYFGEYANSGAGAGGTRASFARKLGGPVAVETVLGGDYKSQGWFDGNYAK